MEKVFALHERVFWTFKGLQSAHLNSLQGNYKLLNKLPCVLFLLLFLFPSEPRHFDAYFSDDKKILSVQNITIKDFSCYLICQTEKSSIFWLTRDKNSFEMFEKEFKIIVVSIFTKKVPKSLYFFSEIWMLDLYLHRLELHVWLKNSWLIVSLIFADTEGWFADFIRSELASNWWGCVISLVELPFVFGITVSRAFGNGPSWFVCCFAGVRAFLWMVSAGAYDLWCWI